MRASLSVSVLAVILSVSFSVEGARTRASRGGEVQADTADVCAALEVHIAPIDSGTKIQLEPRANGPVRIVDFVQFGSAHELPELYLRLAEHGDLVDEMHVVEADRTWTGYYKGFVFKDILAKDPELANWRSRITVHEVKLPATTWGYDVQHAMIEKRYDIPHKGKEGVLLEGDLDEIVSRPVLRALRSCVPKGTKKWDAHVEMNTWKYNFAWTTGRWIWPPIVSELSEAGMSMNASSEGGIPWLQAFSQLRANESSNGTSMNAAVASASSQYVIQKPNAIRLTSGRPAGWHLSWFLDGPEGIAYKYNHCFYPESSLPHYIASNKGHLAEYLRDDFLKQPNRYDDVKPAKKEPMDRFPEAFSEHPEKFKLFIDGMPK